MSQAPVSSPEPRRAPRWMWIALIGSLAVNLLVLGLTMGAAWMHRNGAPFAAAANPLGFIRTLPKERREEIRQASRSQLGAVRPLWQEAREARREVDRQLTLEPFNAEAFLAAQQRMLDKENDARRALAQLFAAAAGKMTIEERRQMLKWRDHHRGSRRDFPAAPRDDDGPRERAR